jgi:glutathione S-transferase
MKLYYSPGACSLSPHIVSREAGIKLDIVKTDLKAKTTDKGGSFLEINGKGYVPTLELDDGQRLTEGPAIVQYLADQKPEMNLAPKAGSMERYRLQEWLNFISTELHKGFSPLFNPAMPDEAKKIARDRLTQRLSWLDKQLAGKEYLMGNQFTVADAYAFTVLNWTGPTKIDLAEWPNLKSYHGRIAKRPAVQEAMKAEGLIK